MDALNSGTYGLNCLDLTIDISAQADVELTYWYKEYGDENHAEDGCFISDDGVKFHLVQSHNDGPETWTLFTVDIDAAAASLGLDPGSAFVIRFSQYDNSSLTSDGICIDDVRVDLPTGPDLSCSVTSLSAAAGGIAIFKLSPGVQYIGREYILLGSASGTSPGIPLQGGILPLNPGFFFNCVLNRLNTANFVHFNSRLGGAGEAYARLNTLGPINPMAIGMHFDFAFTTANPFDFQSGTVGIDVTP
jgi:hypothetical protein